MQPHGCQLLRSVGILSIFKIGCALFLRGYKIYTFEIPLLMLILRRSWNNPKELIYAATYSKTASFCLTLFLFFLTTPQQREDCYPKIP